jgi:hypothetical protein
LPTQDAPTQEASAEADKVAFIEPELPAAPVDDHAAALSWSDLTAAVPVTPEKSLDPYQVTIHEELDPVLELPALPNHDAVITAATEAARLAFSELNTLPGSGASVETSDRHASATEHKDSLSAPAPADIPAAPTSEMIDAVVSRLLAQMQPQIMEVVNREVLRPAIEAIVRREMKKS